MHGKAWVVAAVGAVCGIGAVLLPGGAARPDLLTAQVLVGPVGLLVAIALAARRASTRVPVLVAAVVALAAAVGPVLLAWDDVAGGLPGSATPVLALACVATALGLAACAAGRSRATAAVAALLVVAVSALGLLAPGLPVRATTAAAEVPVPAAPGRPGSTPWTWQGADLREVVAAGTGVVAADDGDTVTALDGATGQVRWRHERSGTWVRALTATPDRRLVLAAFGPGDTASGTELLVTFDAVTGAVLAEVVVDELDTDDGFLAITNTVRAARELIGEDDHRITAHDLRTGALRWTWTAPRGCTAPFMLAVAAADVVPVHQECPDQAGFVGLDDRTGTPRWTHPVPARATLYPTGSRDGSLLSVRADAGTETLLRASDGLAVMTADPDEYPQAEAGAVPLLTDERGGVLGTIDPSTGATTRVSLTCDPPTTTTTPTALLYPCDDELVVQPMTGGGSTTTPVTTRPIPAHPVIDQYGSFHGRPSSTRLLDAPGAVVIARAETSAITGYPAD